MPILSKIINNGELIPKDLHNSDYCILKAIEISDDCDISMLGNLIIYSRLKSKVLTTIPFNLLYCSQKYADGLIMIDKNFVADCETIPMNIMPEFIICPSKMGRYSDVVGIKFYFNFLFGREGNKSIIGYKYLSYPQYDKITNFEINLALTNCAYIVFSEDNQELLKLGYLLDNKFSQINPNMLEYINIINWTQLHSNILYLSLSPFLPNEIIYMIEKYLIDDYQYPMYKLLLLSNDNLLDLLCMIFARQNDIIKFESNKPMQRIYIREFNYF